MSNELNVKLPNWANPKISERYLKMGERSKRLKLLHQMREHLKATLPKEIYQECYAELQEMFLFNY